MQQMSKREKSQFVAQCLEHYYKGTECQADLLAKIKKEIIDVL